MQGGEGMPSLLGGERTITLSLIGKHTPKKLLLIY
jgi:hypothetical protein